MRKALILTVLFAAAAVALPAQTVTDIFYNCFNDSVAYFSKGKAAAKPRFRKNSEVVLHLTEFNNLRWTSKIEVEKISESAATGAAGLSKFAGLAAGFLPGVGSFFGSKTAAADGSNASASPFGLPFLDIPLLKINDKSITLKSLFEGTRGAGEMIAQTDEATKNLAASMEEFRAGYNELRAMENAAAASRLAIAVWANLKNNPQVQPSTIRKMTAEFYQKVFRTTGSSDFSANDLLNWQQLPADFAQNVETLRQRHATFSTQKTRLDALAAQLLQMDEGNDPNFASYSADLRTTQRQARDTDEQWKKTIAAAEKMQTSGWLPDLPTMAALQLEMIAVLQNTFTQTHRIPLDSDALAVEIKIFSKKNEKDTAATLPVKNTTLRLRTSGGLSVRTGVGLQFGQFFEPAQEFSAREGFIVAEDAGRFAPSLSTMLHFLLETRGGLSPGFSFGLGMPLLAGGGKQGVQFFFAPALSVGKARLLTFNGGLMIGQVQRLARGFEAGDAFNVAAGDIPTRQRFETGWFFGLNFNMGKF